MTRERFNHLHTIHHTSMLKEPEWSEYYNFCVELAGRPWDINGSEKMDTLAYFSAVFDLWEKSKLKEKLK